MAHMIKGTGMMQRPISQQLATNQQTAQPVQRQGNSFRFTCTVIIMVWLCIVINKF